MYFSVPINNGELDIDYQFLEQGVQKSEIEAYVKLRKGYIMRPSWQAITEEEWLAVRPPEPIPMESSQETTEQRLARLEEQNLILMDALATTFEEVLMLREIIERGTA